MKKQITRLSPHQNGKILGILMAVSSLVFFIPMALYFAYQLGSFSKAWSSMQFFIWLPLIYLVLGYFSVVVACTFYNFMNKFLGGIEYEASDVN